MNMLFKIVFAITLIKHLNSQFLNPQSFSNVCQSGIREDNTNYIYCARRNLNEVPLFSKNNVVYDELVLSDNRINQLTQTSFSRIKVKKVYLNGNPIKRIDAQSFSKLENNLEELWLDADTSSLNEFELEQSSMIGLPKAIMNLRNLNTLRLKGFLVKTLDSSILKRLNRIEILSLQFCSIENIEKSAFEGLKNSLKELYLDGNQLQSIPTDSLLTAGFRNLKVLSISQNNIKTININSFGFSVYNNFYDFLNPGLSSLTKLDLSYNGLKSVDSQAFNSFNSSLEVLLLQNNEINSYNLNFLRQLQILKDLNLDFNLISNLGSGLFIKSSKLQYLTLQGNSIQFQEEENDFSLRSSVSSVFEGLVGLQRLNLARNGIKHIPNGLFKPIRTLKSLILDKNLIDNLNEFTFDGLFTSLMNISLQNTKLKSSNLKSLKNFEKLERVKLGFNELSAIEWSLFTKMHSTLTNLDLQNNKISQIEYDLTDSSSLLMENLLELDLSNNKLCEFNSNLLDKMPKLKNLGLAQNPLYCDCNLLPLYEWTRRKFDKDILNYIQWQCEMPVNFQGSEAQNEFFNKLNNNRKFTSLTANDFICSNKTKSKCPSSQTQPVSLIPSTLSSKYTSHSVLVVADSNSNSQTLSRISGIQLKQSLNTVFVNWELDVSDEVQLTNENMRGFKLTYSKTDNSSDFTTFLVDKSQRAFKIDNLAFESRYTVCVSIVRSQGYDKYCRDIQLELPAGEHEPGIKSTKKQIKSTNQSALLTSLSAVQSSSSDSYLSSNSTIVSSLMISILVILLIFIFSLIAFLYFYIKKCRLNQNNLKKSLYSGSTANTIGSTRRAIYQGAILTNNIDHSKQTESILNNEVKQCCCHLGQNTIGNQRFMVHNYTTGCTSMGRALAVGDTSTVSSTLSSVNNNANNSNNLVGEVLTISPTNNINEWRIQAPNQKGYESNKVALMATSGAGELASSTPTSFTHFIMQPNSQQSNEQTYMPYELYNCFQNSNTATLIVPANQQQIQFISNQNSHKSKLMQQNQFGFCNVINTSPNTNDHVYCEIPSTIGRSSYRPNFQMNPNDTQLLINNNSNCIKNSHSNNRQNTSASLLLSSSTSSSTSSNSSSPQSNFTNNTKYTNASII